MKRITKTTSSVYSTLVSTNREIYRLQKEVKAAKLIVLAAMGRARTVATPEGGTIKRQTIEVVPTEIPAAYTFEKLTAEGPTIKVAKHTLAAV